MNQGWLWEHSLDGTARFVLGTVGENPLVCFGVNPSTARPGALDPTVNRVQNFAFDNGYDSWIMLNLYPQISTDPNGLHEVWDIALSTENERHIANVIRGGPSTLLAAWGGLIMKRPFLRQSLRRILDIADASECTWLSINRRKPDQHPLHPLYQRADSPLVPYDPGMYRRQPR